MNEKTNAIGQEIATLSSRREFLFLYDIKMGNPNGDPDENRPRVLPDGTFYVTDVRLKRFIRDYLKTQKYTCDGKQCNYDILVDTVEGKTTNLTGRVAEYLKSKGLKECEGKDLVNILLDAFIDARLFGSSFAFKAKEREDEDGDAQPEEEAVKNEAAAPDKKAKGKGKSKEAKWEPKPEPKTLTGPVQIHHGEVLHQAQEVDIHGTCIFGSQEEKKQGTFTSSFILRYALIGFSGVANEHSAKRSRLADSDYDVYLKAMWQSVRAAANTRTKAGQQPIFLVNVVYKPGVEFQYGRLTDYVKLVAATGKPQKEWASPADYLVDIAILAQRLDVQRDKIAQIHYCVSPDLQLVTPMPQGWHNLALDGPIADIPPAKG